MKAFKCLHSARLELPKKKFGRRNLEQHPECPENPKLFSSTPGCQRVQEPGDSPFSAELIPDSNTKKWCQA